MSGVSRASRSETSRFSLRDQVVRNGSLIAICVGAAVVVLAGIYGASAVSGVPVSVFTRDPSDVMNIYFYLGAMSYLGLMLWSASATVCFFSALVMRGREGGRPTVRFLLVSGALCTLLLLDDTFMFHERVFPHHLNVPELGVFAGYAIVFGVYLVCFMRRIMGTDYLLLVLAVLSLGTSAVMDQALPFSNLETFTEDAFKFLGIVLWLAYFARTSLTLIGASRVDAEGVA